MIPVIKVPSDPTATYEVLEMVRLSTDIVHVTTCRSGLMGKSYSKREVDCRQRLFRYLGDGGTLAEMKTSKAEPELTPIVPNSISWVIGKFACESC